MPDVQRIEDGDALGVAWPGAEPHLYRPGDDRSATLAFVKAVNDGVLRGQVPEETTAREVAAMLGGRIGITKDAADYGNAAIVAWWPPEELAEELAIPNGLLARDLHLTLLYLGDASKLDLDLVAALCKLHAASHTYDGPLEGRIGGMGRFVIDAETDCVVALLDVPGLENMRRCLRDDLYCHGAVPAGSPLNDEEHGYVPHITLGYFAKTQASPPPYTETIPLAIDNVTIAAGPARRSYEFTTYADRAHDGAEVAYYASLAGVAGEATTKAGRVLSAASLASIRDAVEAMNGLLTRAEGREHAGSLDDGGSGDDLDLSGGTLEGATDLGKEAGEDSEVEYVIEKADKKKRYTLGPLYAPNRKDAHNEWVEPDALQEAVWDYVRMSADEGRELRLQHGDGTVTVGEWVEVMAWPYEHTITLTKAGADPREVTMPAGTVYMGVVWTEKAWPLVEEGKLGGLSMGGRSLKIGTPSVDLDKMG